MRNLFIVLIICISQLPAFVTYAQDGQNAKERIEAYKVAFLTHRLNLTPEEAKTFWPVYNQFQSELETLRKNRAKKRAKARANKLEMSDKEIQELVDGEIIFKQMELNVIKKYHAQFKQILPIKKVALLYKAEEDFKRELLQRLGNKKPANRR